MRKQKREKFQFKGNFASIINGYMEHTSQQIEQEGIEKFLRRRVRQIIAEFNGTEANQYYAAWRYEDLEWNAALEFVKEWVEDKREYAEVKVGPDSQWTSWSYYKEVYSLRGKAKWELVIELKEGDKEQVTITIDKNARYRSVLVDEIEYVYDENGEWMYPTYEWERNDE